MKLTAKNQPQSLKEKTKSFFIRIWKGIGEGLEEMGKTLWDSGFHYPPFL